MKMYLIVNGISESDADEMRNVLGKEFFKSKDRCELNTSASKVTITLEAESILVSVGIDATSIQLYNGKGRDSGRFYTMQTSSYMKIEIV